jgi:hypothetical protein
LPRGDRLWWAWTLALLALAGALLYGAARWLDDAGLGSASFGRSGGACDSSLVGGLVLLVAAGACLAAAAASVDRRVPGSAMVWDWARLAFALPVPAAGLALTVPGILGCAAAARIERMGATGEALLGTPGAALGAACALALGASIASGLRTERAWAVTSAPVDGDWDASAELVERALADTEAQERADDAGRFRGVDS